MMKTGKVILTHIINLTWHPCSSCPWKSQMVISPLIGWLFSLQFWPSNCFLQQCTTVPCIHLSFTWTAFQSFSRSVYSACKVPQLMIQGCNQWSVRTSMSILQDWFHWQMYIPSMWQFLFLHKTFFGEHRHWEHLPR